MKRVLVLAALCALAACKKAPPGPRPLIVYLHGTLKPNSADFEDQTWRAVVEMASERGFDVWSPRGEIGLCDWNDEAKKDVCWPSDERKLDDAKRIVATFKPHVEGRPVYLLGFSNGASFAVLVAAHALLPTKGVAALHGAPAGPLRVSPTQTPMLLYAGVAPWEKPQLGAAFATLRDAGVSVQFAEGPGQHSLDKVSIDAALTFFSDHR